MFFAKFFEEVKNEHWRGLTSKNVCQGAPMLEFRTKCYKFWRTGESDRGMLALI
jgi:hypothetical protein